MPATSTATSSVPTNGNPEMVAPLISPVDSKVSPSVSGKRNTGNGAA
jgi:hypothetical protein